MGQAYRNDYGTRRTCFNDAFQIIFSKRESIDCFKQIYLNFHRAGRAYLPDMLIYKNENKIHRHRTGCLLPHSCLFRTFLERIHRNEPYKRLPHRAILRWRGVSAYNLFHQSLVWQEQGGTKKYADYRRHRYRILQPLW